MKILDEALGRPFTDPDPDHARAFFAAKTRRKIPKLIDLKTAVSRYVHDGDYLVIGGFGAVRAPMAAVHEIVRQGRKHLGFAGHTSTHDIQVLTVGGCYDRVDAAYVVGLEARGLSKAARRRFESGEVEVVEDSNHGLALRFRAAAMGVPFIPMRNTAGTDTFRYGNGKIVEDPYTGKPVVIKPALYGDVAFIHVHEADIYGNARFRGIEVSDRDVANSAKRVVITTERLVPHEEITRAPELVRIPYYLVDAVCEVPHGAYPGLMPYEYFSDEAHLKEWLRVENDPDEYRTFVDEYVYGCADHGEYVAKCGGLPRIMELRRIELNIDEEIRSGARQHPEGGLV
jgi:glutaconate CoA-transferase subunit A